MAVESIVHEFDLDCAPERAFEVYTSRIGEWWDPMYTANPQTLEAVTIEPGVGGRVFASHREEGEHDWGRVTVWEPGQRLAYTSTLAQDQGHPSEVTVQFAPKGDGSHVRFEHGGWHEGNLADRMKFTEWPVILQRFAMIANGR
jgi:uncharacterized protein YndB with AHSA1/START domain